MQRAEAEAVAASDAAVSLRAELAAAQQSAAETAAALGSEQHSARQAAAAAAEARQRLQVSSSSGRRCHAVCQQRWAAYRLLQAASGCLGRGHCALPQLRWEACQESSGLKLHTAFALQERHAEEEQRLGRQVAQWQREALALRNQLAEMQVAMLAFAAVVGCGGNLNCMTCYVQSLTTCQQSLTNLPRGMFRRCAAHPHGLAALSD